MLQLLSGHGDHELEMPWQGGKIELLGEDKVELTQSGHVVDGSASGFTAILERSDTLPEVPIKQTFP